MRENHQARKGTTLQGILRYMPSAGYISPSRTTLFFKKEMLTLGDLCNKLGNELLSHLGTTTNCVVHPSLSDSTFWYHKWDTRFTCGDVGLIYFAFLSMVLLFAQIYIYIYIVIFLFVFVRTYKHSF